MAINEALIILGELLGSQAPKPECIYVGSRPYDCVVLFTGLPNVPKRRKANCEIWIRWTGPGSVDWRVELGIHIVDHKPISQLDADVMIDEMREREKGGYR